MGALVNKYHWRAKLAYRFDNIMAKGIVALIGLLGLASLLFIGVVSAVVSIFGLYPPEGPLGFFEVFWASLLRTLDPGTMGQDDGFGFRAAMLVVTLSGVILVASLIGVISNAFNARIEQLRKGRSKVLEKDHTLILGWNSKIFSIIHEVAVANLSRTNPCIVILADKDKVEMEDEIHAKIKQRTNSRIIVRSGDPMSLIDLEIANPTQARSIVILASDDEPDADSISIKTCLALVNSNNRKEGEYHIIGEIKSEENLEAAHLVGGKEAHWVLGDDLIARLIVQTCRQSGLSAVFTELLDFDGAELYPTKQPSLVGKTYGVAMLSFTQGCAVGLIQGSHVELNPSPDRIITENDEIIVIAEDDSAISVGSLAQIDDSVILPVTRPLHEPEKTLILGYNKSLREILGEMAHYMANGSEVTIVTDTTNPELGFFEGLKVNYVEADPTDNHILERLDVKSFDHIVVLADRERFSVQKGDARTLLTLLHLREMAKRQGAALNIVSEMLDDRNRELAETTDADDFIVSDKLVSLMLAQLEENPELSHVFSALLSSDGSEIRLHPAEWYVALGVPVDFNTVIAAAAKHFDSALGFSIASQKKIDHRLFGVTLNPNRTQKVVFEPGDRIVVLTND
jgi:voltage-gated potassium channel Kch